MKNYKEDVGKEVFNGFEGRITSDHFTNKKFAERIEVAAEIAEEMPFVTLPFREHGILRNGEQNTHILHVFQPNLWAQDYAHKIDKLSVMTVETAVERAEATTSYVLEKSQSINKVLKATGTDVYNLLDSMREAAMIESAYYTRLGNGEMSEEARKKIDVALMRRAVRDKSLFKTVLKHVGVSETDFLAMLQFSEEMDLTGILQKFVELDPYYNRRMEQIGRFSEMNAEKSIKIPQSKTSKFFEELIIRLGRRYPSMVKRVATAIEDDLTTGGR